jgi:hypothetical protein
MEENRKEQDQYSVDLDSVHGVSVVDLKHALL